MSAISNVLALTFATLVALGVTSGAGLASAQSTPGDTAERARQHMEAGQDLYLQERYLEAAEEFKRAYEAQQESAFLYNAAVAYERHRDYSQAADYFARYIEQNAAAADAADIRHRIDLLRTRAAGEGTDTGTGTGTGTGTDTGNGTGTGTGTGEGTDAGSGTGTVDAAGEAGLAVAIGETTAEQMKSLLSVRSNPAGAQITVTRGDESVSSGSAPIASTLDQGHYRVRVEHPDYQDVEAEVTVRPGRVYVVIVEMSQGAFLGYLRVTSDVPGARVYVDDRDAGEVGRTPWSNVVPIGTHRIWVDRPGYEVQELEVEVGLGDRTEVPVELTRTDDGRIRVNANVRGAHVHVDGHEVGRVPWEGPVPAGPHRLSVSADGMKTYATRVDVERGQMTPVRVRLRPAPDRGGAIATLVVSGLFLAGGITAGVLANDLQSQLEEERDDGSLADNDQRISTGQILAISADIAFGVSFILGGLSLYYFLVDNLPDSEGQVRDPRDWSFAPYVSPDGAGAATTVRF